MDGLILRIYLWASRWAVRQAIIERSRLRDSPHEGRFTRGDVNLILNRTWKLFDSFANKLPRSDVSTRRVLILACLTHALFGALLETGIERAYAIELISDTIWKLYGRMYRLRHFLNSWLTPLDRGARMRLSASKAFHHLPPSYEWRSVPSNSGISFEILSCPVAEYFRAQDAADLCIGAWCNQDYGLAEIWGGRFERDGSIASGSDRCDFGFKDLKLT